MPQSLWELRDRILDAVVGIDEGVLRGVSYVTRLHSDVTCAASPVEGTSSSCEKKKTRLLGKCYEANRLLKYDRNKILQAFKIL
jgi:hypothetical protein